MQRLLLTSTLEHFGSKLPLVFGDKLAQMNVLCIPTAAYAEEGFEDWLSAEQAPLKQTAKSYAAFDIAGKSNQELQQALTGIDILYVTGGNTFCLLEAMSKINFANVLSAFFERGGVYVGSSAGSVVTCPDIAFAGAMDEPDKANLTTTRGLGLVDFAFIPHLDHPTLSKHVEVCAEAAEKTNKTIIALNDDQALWVEDGYVRIY